MQIFYLYRPQGTLSFEVFPLFYQYPVPLGQSRRDKVLVEKCYPQNDLSPVGTGYKFAVQSQFNPSCFYPEQTDEFLAGCQGFW